MYFNEPEGVKTKPESEISCYYHDLRSVISVFFLCYIFTAVV